MLYKFEYNLTDKEFYEFNKYLLTDSPDAKKAGLRWKLYVPAVFLIMFIRYIIRGDDWFLLSIALFIFGVGSVIWWFSLKPLLLLWLKARIKILKKNGKLPYSQHSILEFYDDYFIEKTENTKEEIRYNAVSKIGINKNKAIYIFRNTVAYIIPFSVFSSDNEINEFLDFVCKKTDK